MIKATCDHRLGMSYCDAYVDGYHFKDLRERLNANGWKWCSSNSQLPLVEYLYCKFHTEQFESRLKETQRA